MLTQRSKEPHPVPSETEHARQGFRKEIPNQVRDDKKIRIESSFYALRYERNPTKPPILPMSPLASGT